MLFSMCVDKWALNHYRIQTHQLAFLKMKQNIINLISSSTHLNMFRFSAKCSTKYSLNRQKNMHLKVVIFFILQQYTCTERTILIMVVRHSCKYFVWVPFTLLNKNRPSAPTPGRPSEHPKIYTRFANNIVSSSETACKRTTVPWLLFLYLKCRPLRRRNLQKEMILWQKV